MLDHAPTSNAATATTTLASTPRPQSDPADLKPSLAAYGSVTSLLLLWSAAHGWLVTRLPNARLERAQDSIGPMSALVALTAVVWLAMVGTRNLSVLLGRSSARYYIDYVSNTPQEWVERPARAFNNLLQLPTLFYVAGTLALLTDHVDRVQLTLAWIFVAARAVHAFVYIGWNSLPYRFGSWVASCITLGVIWYRLTAAVFGW